MRNLNKVEKALETRKNWAETANNEPLWPNGPTPKEYVGGFVRKSGSYVAGINNMEQLAELFSKLENIEEVTAKLPESIVTPGHTYLIATVPTGYKAFEAISVVEDLSEEELAEVSFVKNEHGIDLEINGNPRETKQLAFICDQDGLVTWYPGRFTENTSGDSWKEIAPELNELPYYLINNLSILRTKKGNYIFKSAVMYKAMGSAVGKVTVKYNKN